MAPFRFKQFSVSSEGCGLKVGTDGVLLGAAVTVDLVTACNAMNFRKFRVLDVGTGSGLIALMIAQRIAGCFETMADRPQDGMDWNVVGIDIDGNAAKTAEANFAASPWACHLESRHLPLAGFDCAEFDLIVSNPPYYDTGLVSPDAGRALARSVDSLSYRELSVFAARHLSGTGRLGMILPKSDETAALRYAASYGLFPVRILEIKTTQAKPPSRVILELASGRKSPLNRESFVIHEGNGYSEAYRRLTAEFYL